MRAREVLTLHCDLAHVPRVDRPAAVDTALELVGLADRAEDLVGTFSKGMQQRLGLGVALLGAPDLVAAIVAAGGRVHEVDAGRRSLEERFLALLSRSRDGTDRTP